MIKSWASVEKHKMCKDYIFCFGECKILRQKNNHKWKNQIVFNVPKLNTSAYINTIRKMKKKIQDLEKILFLHIDVTSLPIIYPIYSLTMAYIWNT